jgi:hypothetical protein
VEELADRHAAFGKALPVMLGVDRGFIGLD